MSPTEPKELRGLGKVSSTPEQYGVDFLWVGTEGLIGVQRKEMNDLVASLQDGRLAKELSQMQRLDACFLVIEGRLLWSREDYLLTARSFSRAQYHGALFSILAQGVSLLYVETLSETAQLLTHLEKWSSKDRHGYLRTRPKATGVWGKADNRDWGIHLLQSFPGIGQDVAAKIYDHFGGLPLTWTVDSTDLQQVKGVGKIRAERMIDGLCSDEGTGSQVP